MCSSDLVNLMENGIKASVSGGKIIISTSIEVDTITISVTDFGVGMDKLELEKITQPFYMIDTSRKGNNTGIGLAICEEIAKLHSTSLHFKSEKNIGTTVSFTMNGGMTNE